MLMDALPDDDVHPASERERTSLPALVEAVGSDDEVDDAFDFDLDFDGDVGPGGAGGPGLSAMLAPPMFPAMGSSGRLLRPGGPSLDDGDGEVMAPRAPRAPRGRPGHQRGMYGGAGGGPGPAPRFGKQSKASSASHALNPLAGPGAHGVIKGHMAKGNGRMSRGMKATKAGGGLSAAGSAASMGGAAASLTGIGALGGVPAMVAGKLASAAGGGMSSGGHASIASGISGSREMQYGTPRRQVLLESMADDHRGKAAASGGGVAAMLDPTGIAGMASGAASKAHDLAREHQLANDPEAIAWANDIHESGAAAASQRKTTKAMKKSGRFTDLEGL